DTGMEVPGTFWVGAARNSSSVFASQVRWAFIIAGVNLAPGTVPDSRPTTPASDGPMPCFPGSIEWHAAHLGWDTVLPASASPSASACVPVSTATTHTNQLDFPRISALLIALSGQTRPLMPGSNRFESPFTDHLHLHGSSDPRGIRRRAGP